jgi:hypothetical protein
MRGSIWPFESGSPRDIEQAEAMTTKEQTIQKRTEPAFIAPMQCKPGDGIAGWREVVI